MPISRLRWASARPNGRARGRPKVSPEQAQNHQKRGPAAPRLAPGLSTVRVHGAESTRVMCGLPLCRVVAQAKNRARHLQDGRRRDLRSLFKHIIHLDNVGATFLFCFELFLPQMVSVGLIASCCPKPKIGCISSWTDRNAIPRALSPRANPQFGWFPHLIMDKCSATRGFCPPGARLVPIWANLAHTSPHHKGVNNGSKIGGNHFFTE